jgi:hypothetical protein
MGMVGEFHGREVPGVGVKVGTAGELTDTGRKIQSGLPIDDLGLS